MLVFVIKFFPALMNKVSTSTWHYQFGHPSFNYLNTIRSILSYDMFYVHNDLPCNICPLAKQRKLPFVTLNNIYSCSFDFMHIDICGSYHVTSYNSFIYCITMVDDRSRFSWIYLLKHKSDAIPFVRRYIFMIETQF